MVAPSGTGKTTLNNKLCETESDHIELSVSYTTRKKRPYEVDGDHYHFVEEAKFLSLVENNQMLEWAKVHDNYYGTPLQEIERIAQLGKKALLEIDIQGWLSTHKILPHAVSIFILPPSIQAMWKRLENRGTDDLSTRLRRLKSAKAEFEKAHYCNHFIINDHLEEAYENLRKVIIGGSNPPLDRKDALNHIESLLKDLNAGEWSLDSLERQS